MKQISLTTRIKIAYKLTFKCETAAAVITIDQPSKIQCHTFIYICSI